MSDLKLTQQDIEGATAALHVEQKIVALQSTGLDVAQLERARAEHRARAHKQLTPAAQEAVRMNLVRLGILKLDREPANDPNFLGKYFGGEAA